MYFSDPSFTQGAEAMESLSYNWFNSASRKYRSDLALFI